MGYFPSRLVTRAVAIGTGVGATAGAYFCWRSYSWGKSNRIAAVSLSAQQFNAIQNQQLLYDALLPTHLPWTYHSLQHNNVGTNACATSTLCSKDSTLKSTNSNDVCDNKKCTNNCNVNQGYQLTLYRLLGCPYCAKVQALLNYYDVPYKIMGVDPLNGKGIPDPRYRQTPQIKFTRLNQTCSTQQSSKSLPTSQTAAVRSRQQASSLVTSNNKELKQEQLLNVNDSSALIVDSAYIISAFGKPLGYDDELHNPHIIATREWITNHFKGASFAIINGTFTNAFQTHTIIVQEKYRTLYYRILGAMALNILARIKIRPRLLSNVHPFIRQYETSILEPNRQSFAVIARNSPMQWLNVELNVFLSRRPQNSIFHGGNVPDLADIEMYGVTRVIDNHPTLRAIARNSEFGKWQSAMQQVMLKRNHHL